MEKLVLLCVHDKRTSRLIFFALLITQILISYFLFTDNQHALNFANLMYVPVCLAAFFFTIPLAVMQALLGGVLLSIANSMAMYGGIQIDMWSYGLFNTMNYLSAALIIGSLKNKIVNFYMRREDVFYYDEFTGLLNMTAFVRDIHDLSLKSEIEYQKIVLAEILNQDEIGAAFGIDFLYKVSGEFEKYVSEYCQCKVVLYQIRLNMVIILFPPGHAMDKNRLKSRPTQTVYIDNIPVYLDVVCGGCDFPRDGKTANELLQKGFIALQEARNQSQLYSDYDPSMKPSQRIPLLGQIQDALQKKQIVFYYQPILDSKNRVRNLEALARWNHPGLGVLPPSQFIPDLELTGLSNSLVNYSLDYNLRNLNELNSLGYDFTMSINISITNLQQADFSENVFSALSANQMAPNKLVLEITEHGFLSDSEISNRNIRDLTKAGVAFDIDDFGVGSTSIGNLRKFGIHAIKIDQSYIMDLDENQVNKAVVNGIISMVKDIGIETVAEGVESWSLLEQLKRMGIDYFQGYAISPPLPYEKLVPWISGYTAAHGNMQ
jgi:EAL domain-containing protein (putative c-di-GMP-specific phosphodiesterase class I)